MPSISGMCTSRNRASYRPPESTPSSVGLMMLLTVCGVSACDERSRTALRTSPTWVSLKRAKT